MKSVSIEKIGFAFLGLGLWLTAGCATMGPPQPVYVRTHMSPGVFLDIADQTAKTVFIRFRDSSGTDSGVAADIEASLKDKLMAEGYTLVFSPRGAFYVVQADIRYLGERDSADMGAVLGAGFGGAVVGGLVGGQRGEGLGLLAGLLAGSAVRHVTYALVTDVEVTERDARDDQYQTRVVSYASQTDLAFSRAEPALANRQADAIAGIF